MSNYSNFEDDYNWSEHDVEWVEYDDFTDYVFDQKFMDTLIWIEMLPTYKGELK